MLIEINPSDLPLIEGTYKPSKLRKIVSGLASVISIFAVVYGLVSLTWIGPDLLDVVLIFLIAVGALPVGVLTYGGKIIVGESSIKIEFFFGLKRYKYKIDEIKAITLLNDNQKFTPLTIYQEGMIYPMPANKEFIDRVLLLQQVAGGDATR
ncbi:MAG: hypothetical protein AB3N14_09605 [Flavobacteriaceae bacterium]